MDRERLAVVYEQHFMPSGSGMCRCGFNTTKTEEGDRDHKRGWSTSAPHMRKAFARHLADEYNKVNLFRE